MKVAIIGRSESLYNTAKLLMQHGYKISLIITAKEAPEYKVTHKDFEELASKTGATYLYTPKVNFSEHKTFISECGRIDIAISVNYTGVIQQNVIDMFPNGILNAHAGDLPRYRGNAVFAWAIINRERTVGLCVHKMKGGELDSGDLIAKSYRNINISTRIGELYEWIENEIPVLMLEGLKKIERDNKYILEEQSKDPANALRCYPRNPEDGKIDWQNDNETIVRLINASSEPFQGAFCSFNDQKIIVWRAEIFKDSEIYCAIPGQVCSILGDNSVVVSTGQGKVKINEVEYNNIRVFPSSVIKSLRSRLK